MTKLAQQSTTVDAVIDTGGGRLVLLLPTSMRGNVFALEHMPAGTKFLGVYLLGDHAATMAVRKMLGAGFNIRIDGRQLNALGGEYDRQTGRSNNGSLQPTLVSRSH